MKDVMELQINSNTLDTSYSNIRNERRVINYVTAFIRESEAMKSTSGTSESASFLF